MLINEHIQSVNATLLAPENSLVFVYTKNGQGTENDLWISKIDGQGNSLWGDSGISVCNAPETQKNPHIIQHPGGYFIAWEDSRIVVNRRDQVYLQAISQDGDVEWMENGVRLANTQEDCSNPKLALDEDGFIWCVWEDYRRAANGLTEIYTQKINPLQNAPELMFTEFARQIVTNTRAYRPQVVSDSRDGTWVVWENRNENSVWIDVYASHLNSDGRPAGDWGLSGQPVCSAFHNQSHPQAILLDTDGNTGIAVVWEDARVTGKEEIHNIYMQRVDDDFQSVGSDQVEHPTEVMLYPAYPNPFNSSTLLAYSVPKTGELSLNVYDLQGRLVNNLFGGFKIAGNYDFMWNAGAFPSGIYLVSLKQGSFNSSRKITLIR